MTAQSPLRITIFNDAEIMVQGLSRMLEPYADRVTVVPGGGHQGTAIDIVLYDDTDPALDLDVTELLRTSGASRAVAYSWAVSPELVHSALGEGAHGCLSKQLGAADLVGALERIHRGEIVVSTEPDPGRASGAAPPPAAPESAAAAATAKEPDGWPGQEDGLTERESQVIAMIARGLSNQEIADRSYLSINSVKSYIRSSYRKMGVTSRSRAVLWAIERGFRIHPAAPSDGGPDAAARLPG